MFYNNVSQAYSLHNMSNDANFSIRPVINIKSDVLINEGIGTFEEPYIIG